VSFRVTHIFTDSEIERFALLSGDYNVIHVDPVAARRELFGRPIVHGMLVVLKAVDCFLSHGDSVGREWMVKRLDVRFMKPVFPGDTVSITGLVEDAGTVQLEVASRTGRLLLIDLALFPCHLNPMQPLAPPTSICRQAKSFSIDDNVDGGDVSVWLNRQLAFSAFPGLMTSMSAFAVAELAALSRLVGMEYPGDRSVFSQLNLRMRDDEGQGGAECRYRVKRRDSRFSLVELDIEGTVFQGSVRAFFRPVTAAQPSYASICSRVEPGVFSGWRTVVVGGSRGLGEVTAKILAAGGARVLLTYRNSKEEAGRVAKEIAVSGDADVMPFDVLAPALPFAREPATHLFYFATPHIFQQREAPFDESLFNTFMRYYVTGFLKTVQLFPGAAVFYPSSVAVDEHTPDLLEYAGAKFIGEQICRELNQRKERRVWFERLPRVATDQTLTVTGHQAANGLDVMLPVLMGMCAQRVASNGREGKGKVNER
jgi:acyl dehydratase